MVNIVPDVVGTSGVASPAAVIKWDNEGCKSSVTLCADRSSIIDFRPSQKRKISVIWARKRRERWHELL